VKKANRYGLVLAQLGLFALTACGNDRTTATSARPLTSLEADFKADCVGMCTSALPNVTDCGAWCDGVVAKCVGDPGTGSVNVNDACVQSFLWPALRVETPQGVARCGLDDNCDNKDDCNGSPIFVCCGDKDCNGFDDCAGAPVSSTSCPATCGDADCDGFDDCAQNRMSSCVPAGMVQVPPHVRRRGADQSFTPFAPIKETAGTSDIELTGFLIDKTEVTQSAYSACVDAGQCTPPAANFDPAGKPLNPVTNVTWDQAQAYCAYAGKRLPSEAEWEAAARGPKNFLQPWGNQYPEGASPPCTLGNFRDCTPGTVAVGSYLDGASGYGALDMAGNVSEWVRDVASLRPNGNFGSKMSPPRDPVAHPVTQPFDRTTFDNVYVTFQRDHVFRGGDWASNARYLIATTRDQGGIKRAESWLGFRCARGAKSSCVPDTHCPADGWGKACAKIADGCGGTIDCGPIQTCDAGETCGGGDYPYVCGCDPDKGNCGTTSWANSFIDTQTHRREVHQLVVDSVGNITVAGSVPINTVGGEIAYMWTAGISKTGTLRWSRQLGAGSCIYNQGNAEGLALEPGTDAVFSAGYYGESTTGDYKPALVKYSSTGTTIWQKYFTAYAGSPHGKFRGVVRDNNGDVLVYGEIACGWNLGGSLLGNASKCTGFGVFAKYRGSDGAHLWSVLGPAGGTYGLRSTMTPAITPTGDMLVANNGSASSTIVRMANAGGTWSTIKTLTPSRDSAVHIYSLAADTTGNVYVTGTFKGTVNFGGTSLTSTPGATAPQYDLFTAKYGPNMTSLLWLKRAVSTPTSTNYGGGASTRAIAVDPLGNVWLSGEGDTKWEGRQLDNATGWVLGLNAADGSTSVLKFRTSIGAMAFDPADNALIMGTSKGLGNLSDGGAIGLSFNRALDSGPADAFVSRTPAPAGIDTCVARSCKMTGQECGTVSGCGIVDSCGTCAAGMYCDTSYGRCLLDTNICSGKCGPLSPSNGVSMDCGECPSGQQCGAGGVPNVCAATCYSKTCAELGKNCGTVSHCGQTLDCGTCTSPETCGGGGVTNVCGSGPAAVCGDGVCGCTESPTSCAADCKKTNGPASGQFNCGNGVCETAENATKCKADCGGGC